jgi:hypothetical protein
MRKERVLACLQILLQPLSGLSEGNHEKPQSEMSVSGLKLDRETSNIRSNSDNHSKAAFGEHLI